MAGGTWLTQNKVRPGVYINFVSADKTVGTVGDRGIATMALTLPWGPSKVIVTVEAGADTMPMLGYDITDPVMRPVFQALRRAVKVLIYRLNEGVKATGANGDMTITAKYGGVRGNDIRVVVQANIDDVTKFDVITYLGEDDMDTQTVATIAELAANDWVEFSGTGAPELTAGVNLTGGSDGTVTNADHTAYLAAAEVQDFNTMGLLSNDNTLKPVYSAFVNRVREQDGKKVQVVMPDYPTADYEGVISVKNGVILSDGTVLDKVQAVAWVTGATAGAAMNQSLTYQAYDDAVDVDVRYTNSEIITALQNGEFVFVPSNGRAVVETDINTFTSFTPKKAQERSKNRIIRVLDGIANDFKRIFEQSYIGKVDNNADGRALFRKEIVTYLETLQGISAIQNFDSQTDVNVLMGNTSDSVYVEIDVQPVDSIEKIYMRIRVR